MRAFTTLIPLSCWSMTVCFRGCLRSGSIYQSSTKIYKMWYKIPTRLVESCAIIIWKNEFWDSPFCFQAKTGELLLDRFCRHHAQSHVHDACLFAWISGLRKAGLHHRGHPTGCCRISISLNSMASPKLVTESLLSGYATIFLLSLRSQPRAV